MKAAAKQLTDGEKKWRRRQVYLRTGQAIMIIGGLVAATHWLAHLEAFGPGQPPGWLDLVAGYPTGAILIIAGAILASRKPK